MNEKIKYKTWFQLPLTRSQLKYGFQANQIFRFDDSNWWMSYQPSAPDTGTDETALMPAQIILKGNHKDQLSKIFAEKGKEGCEEYFNNSEDKITEGFMKISPIEVILDTYL